MVKPPIIKRIPIIEHFLIFLVIFRLFWVIENVMGCQLGLYKLLSILEAKDATIQGFKFEILFCLNSPITEH
jgi:hypothetical protein